MSSGSGPGFQDARSTLYRVEYSAISLAVVAYLLWRALYISSVDWLQLVFWLALPDLASFIPIGLSSKRKEWPAWGADLYNVFHTLLVWGVAFAASWFVFGSVYLPLLGWLLHITADRAFGYSLRARPSV